MKRLIVNADDFGLHAAVNRGIRDAHSGGIVTSTSLMAGGAAFDEAVAIAQDCPELGVGVHLTLVGARPVASAVASLVDGEGNFCASYPVFLRRYLQGTIRRDEVARELAAQIEKVTRAGIRPTHLDSHQHLHVVPGITGMVLDLARRFAIAAVRIPAEPLGFFGGLSPSVGRVVGRSGLTVLAGLFRRRALAAGLRVPEHFFGMLAGGQLNEIALQTILQQLPAGTAEIMCHPGRPDAALARQYSWDYHWSDELAALCAPQTRRLLQENGVRLISFREL